MAKLEGIRRFLKGIGSKKTLISFHSLGDLDAVGSALALKRSLRNADVAAPDKVSAEAKKFLKYVGEEIPAFSEINPSDYEVVIVLETSSAALFPPGKEVQIDCILDHHSIHEDALSAKNMFIDTKASATCEIVYKLLGGKVNKRSALCLLVGIIADSYRFRSATRETFEIVGELLAKAKVDYSEVLALTESAPDLPERIALLKACQRAEFAIAGDAVIVKSHVGAYEAHAATAFVQMGADFAFVGSAGKRDARISARMNERFKGKVNLADVMAEIAPMINGTGGGHPVAAGATGTDEKKIGEALDRCVEIVKKELA